jgi:hypothetical protein
VGLTAIFSLFGTDESTARSLARLLIAVGEGGLLRARVERGRDPLIDLIPAVQAAARGLLP